jgi:hypothetical protein
MKLEPLLPTEPNPGTRTHVGDHVCGVECATVERQTDRSGIEEFLHDRYRLERSTVDPGGAPIAVNQP